MVTHHEGVKTKGEWILIFVEFEKVGDTAGGNEHVPVPQVNGLHHSVGDTSDDDDDDDIPAMDAQGPPPDTDESDGFDGMPFRNTDFPII